MLINLLIVIALFLSAANIWMVLTLMARSHWHASIECRKVNTQGEVEKDSYSFSASYSNTILGNTIGRFKVSQARRKFDRNQIYVS